MPESGQEQREAEARETGAGSGFALDGAAPAGGDEPAAGAGGK